MTVDAATGEVVQREDAPTLAELEEVVERGLESFLDVGGALLAIKAGKRYREAGYASFEDYCQRRWEISRGYGYRLVIAAATVEGLQRNLSPIGDTPMPTAESQVRPLTRLPEHERAEAWNEAVKQAETEDRAPTARDVEEVVDRRQPKTTVTERESFSRKVETEPPTGTSEDQGTPPTPASSDGPEVAEPVDVERHADPRLTFRANFSRDIAKAGVLRMVDVDKAVACADPDDLAGFRQSVESIRDWCDRFLTASGTSHLRRVK